MMPVGGFGAAPAAQEVCLYYGYIVEEPLHNVPYRESHIMYIPKLNTASDKNGGKICLTFGAHVQRG